LSDALEVSVRCPLAFPSVELDEIAVSVPNGTEENRDRATTGPGVVDASRRLGHGDVRRRTDTLEAVLEILKIEHQDQTAGLSLAENGLRCRLGQVESLHQAEHADEVIVSAQQDEASRAADDLIVDNLQTQRIAVERQRTVYIAYDEGGSAQIDGYAFTLGYGRSGRSLRHAGQRKQHEKI